MVNKYLQIGTFTISKPEEWDKNIVKVEIQDYDYDSTELNMDQLKILHAYIGQILKEHEKEIK